MANKITAPHSYDPGKGRPKEYLAYLNEREMAYLRSINGNNMERGPRGLPSFPPEDAVGSSSKAGSRGPGGPSGPNSGPSTGGGGKGPGGPSGPNSGPSGGLGGGGKGSAGSSPSSPGGLRGAGGNYGSGSGKPGTTSSPGGYKGPSSPMGGQGPSFSRDTKAQQDAQVRDAIKAVKNSPAFRNDASSGGIRTLSVGPIGTPVNVGPVMGMQPRSPSLSQVIAGDPISYGGPRVGTAPSSLPSVDLSRYPDPLGSLSQYQRISEPIKSVQARPERPAQKEFYERIAPGPFPSTSISSQFPSYKYDAPLTPGMSPEDMARRGALMNQYEREARDIMNRSPDPFSTGNPNMAGNPPAGQNQKENPLAGTGYGTFNIAGVDRMMAAPEDLPPEELRSAAGTYTSPYDAPPVREMKDMTVEEMIRALRPPGRKEDGPFPAASFRKKAAETYTSPYDAPPRELRSAAGTYTSPYDTPQKELRSAAGTYTSPYDAPSTAKNSKLFDDRLITTNGITNEVPSAKINKMTPEDQKKLADSLQTPTYTPPKELRSAAGTYFAPEDVPPNADDVYPKYVEPEVQELMKDIDKKNKRGVKGMKSVPVLGNVVKAYEAGRSLITGKNTTEADADLKRAYMQGSPAQQAELEAKYPNLTKFAQQAGLEPRLPMSNYESWRQRSFGTGGGMGGSTSTTSPGGGITDIGSGGKTEPPRIEQAEKEATKPKPKPKEDGRRPAIYYKWDLGVGVPSPTDSDYTLYLKYLQEKAAAKAGMAR